MGQCPWNRAQFEASDLPPCGGVRRMRGDPWLAPTSPTGQRGVMIRVQCLRRHPPLSPTATSPPGKGGDWGAVVASHACIADIDIAARTWGYNLTLVRIYGSRSDWQSVCLNCSVGYALQKGGALMNCQECDQPAIGAGAVAPSSRMNWLA